MAGRDKPNVAICVAGTFLAVLALRLLLSPKVLDERDAFRLTPRALELRAAA